MSPESPEMFAKHVREFIRAKPDVIFYIDSPEISELDRKQKEVAQSNIPGESSVSAMDQRNPESSHQSLLSLLLQD